MPYPKNLRKGKEFNCRQCGKLFYRGPAQITNGSIHHCSMACLGKSMMGSQAKMFGFGGRRHSEATKQKISESRKGKNLKNQTALGYKHTKEARQKIREASIRLWRESRDKMLQALPRGEDNCMYRGNNRYLREFTPLQKREWKDKTCKWCGTTENLQLDHIIPVWMQELRIRENAQTLCHHCNLWKRQFVETPMYLAFKAVKGTNC